MHCTTHRDGLFSCYSFPSRAFVISSKARCGDSVAALPSGLGSHHVCTPRRLSQFGRHHIICDGCVGASGPGSAAFWCKGLNQTEHHWTTWWHFLRTYDFLGNLSDLDVASSLVATRFGRWYCMSHLQKTDKLLDSCLLAFCSTKCSWLEPQQRLSGGVLDSVRNCLHVFAFAGRIRAIWKPLGVCCALFNPTGLCAPSAAVVHPRQQTNW